jgi:hypothetical protein
MSQLSQLHVHDIKPAAEDAKKNDSSASHEIPQKTLPDTNESPSKTPDDVSSQDVQIQDLTPHPAPVDESVIPNVIEPDNSPLKDGNQISSQQSRPHMTLNHVIPPPPLPNAPPVADFVDNLLTGLIYIIGGFIVYLLMSKYFLGNSSDRDL